MDDLRRRMKPVQRPPVLRAPFAVESDLIVRDAAGRLFPHDDDSALRFYRYVLTGNPPERVSRSADLSLFHLPYAAPRLYNILTVLPKNGESAAGEHWFYEFVGFAPAEGDCLEAVLQEADDSADDSDSDTEYLPADDSQESE